MTPRERDFIAALCASRAGLSVDVERSYVMESRIARVARREGYAAIPDLVRAVRDRSESRLVQAVVEAFAPASPAFFHDPQQLSKLADDLGGRARRGEPVRVWVAACGRGQEVYSLAMLLEERRIDGVELFASDLSERRLEKARAGLFSSIEVQQGLSARRLVRHFSNREEAFLFSARLREPVRWRRMNLIEAPAGVGAFDVILCRGVLPAYLETARPRVLGNLVQALRPGGELVLGAGEIAGEGFAPREGRPGVFVPEGLAVAAA
jgi:chemotaxis protein methyltransferase CheR